MYDRYAKGVVYNLWQSMGKSNLRQNDLKEYSGFYEKATVLKNDINKYFELDLDAKKFDKIIWMFGKQNDILLD